MSLCSISLLGLGRSELGLHRVMQERNLPTSFEFFYETLDSLLLQDKQRWMNGPHKQSVQRGSSGKLAQNQLIGGLQQGCISIQARTSIARYTVLKLREQNSKRAIRRNCMLILRRTVQQFKQSGG